MRFISIKKRVVRNGQRIIIAENGIKFSRTIDRFYAFNSFPDPVIITVYINTEQTDINGQICTLIKWLIFEAVTNWLHTVS
ncbi:hypothetical protein SynA1840_00460 [Synechococcus sp. A18-40]|nr:hypothetical protein SynA1840_00460 [Synechococcus sp. A18-40]